MSSINIEQVNSEGSEDMSGREQHCERGHFRGGHGRHGRHGRHERDGHHGKYGHRHEHGHHHEGHGHHNDGHHDEERGHPEERGHHGRHGHHVNEYWSNRAMNGDGCPWMRRRGPGWSLPGPPQMGPYGPPHMRHGFGPQPGEKILKMKMKIAALKERNKALRKACKENKNKEDEELLKDSSSDEDACMDGCMSGMKRRRMWRHFLENGGEHGEHPWGSEHSWGHHGWGHHGRRHGGPGDRHAGPGMKGLFRFFKPGFGPRGYIWRHVIPAGPIKAENIKARVSSSPSGTMVIVEGREESSVDGVIKIDSFQRTVMLPAAVDEQKLRVLYRRKFGGCIVVRAPRKGDKKHCRKSRNIEPCDPNSCIDLVGCEAECEEQIQDEEASMIGSISKSVDQMLLDDSDSEVDVMEATSGGEEDFEVLVGKQNESAAIPQKLIVSKLSAGQQGQIQNQYFHKKIALNSLKVDSLDVYLTGHVITVKSSEGVAEKHELAVNNDVNVSDIRGYADSQGILHFVASEIAKP